MCVLKTEVYAARAGRLGKTVVGVVLMLGEVFLPVTDQRRRYGLCADVHESPLIELIIGKLDFSAVKGIKDILSPRYQKPYDGALLVGNSLQDDVRFCALEKNCFAACPK